MDYLKLLHAIVNTAIDGIITIDYRGIIETMNPAALKLFGIPEEEQKNLFEPSFGAHNTGNIPGTGLGLNIVKRYIELMGGKFPARVPNI